MRGHKLGSAVNNERALKQNGVKQTGIKEGHSIIQSAVNII
jgi:hypothetical protein